MTRMRGRLSAQVSAAPTFLTDMTVGAIVLPRTIPAVDITSLVGKYIGAYYLEVGDWCVCYLHRVGRLFFEAHYILSIFGFIEVFTQVVKLRV